MTASTHDRLRALGIAAGPILDLAAERDPAWSDAPAPTYHSVGEASQAGFALLAARGSALADDVGYSRELIGRGSTAGEMASRALQNALNAAVYARHEEDWPDARPRFEMTFGDALTWLAAALVAVDADHPRRTVDATYADALRSVAR